MLGGADGAAGWTSKSCDPGGGSSECAYRTLTGEARYYSDGDVADRRYNGRDLQAIRPSHAWGAVELVLRYCELDLNDGAITGGKEHDWTLGASGYIGEHLKVQSNYVWAQSDRGNLQVNPRIFEMRAQVYF